MTRRALAAALTGVALLASGCTQAEKPVDPAVRESAQAAPEAGLARFYEQQLDWSRCDRFQCADLTVPIDYAKPDGDTLTITVLKVKARGTKKGSLVVNPGGPGGSGVDYATYADYAIDAPVRKAYDVVGFDPRGVGRSTPFECVDDKGVDTLISTDPTPDDPGEGKALVAVATSFAAACEKAEPELIRHLSTEDAARDMDVLRAALAEPRLDYLGKSYGTYLGATYANLFPKRVGRMVLDGVVPPDLSAREVARGQAEGFERATTAWLKDCVKGGDCPLGGDVETARARLQKLLRDVDDTPLPVEGIARVERLDEAWASLGLAQALYDQGSWGTLTDAVRSALDGDGTPLAELAGGYANRDAHGRYENNIMQVIYGVNCLDRAETGTIDDLPAVQKDFEKVAPTWGGFLAYGGVVCQSWPVKGGTPQKMPARGSAPILVVGTTRDPATPFEWSQHLVDQLDNGHLLTFDGDGHTAYMRANGCVNEAVNEYYLKGIVPTGAAATC